jgi:hypothetical protein
MAFNQSEKNEIEKIVKSEIKSFLDSQTVKQFENKMLELISKEIERGKLEKNVRDLIAKSMKDFYEYLWMNRSVWESKIKK